MAPGTLASDRVLAALLPLAAWTCYLPLGAKYAALGAAVLAASAALRTRGVSVSALYACPPMPAALALLLLLALSLAWTPAPWSVGLGQLGQYALMLLVPVVAAACPPEQARRSLGHFAVASALVGLLFVIARFEALPASAVLWHTSVDAEGNQRIATSILLALGALLALWLALQHAGRLRATWLVLGALSLLGLTLQDRRSGMLLLPVLAVAWAWTNQPGWLRRLLALAAVLLLAGTTWLTSDMVRQRFDEGVRELQAYRPDDAVATSWGQRLRMWQVTLDMVAERPLRGHGIGSWKQRWRERITPGTALAQNTTPHNEYLLLAQQAGVFAPLLWLWWLVRGAHASVRAGAVPAVLAWTALGWIGLFNAVLRDAKFALPLLLLLALALAAGRSTPAERPAA